MQGNIRAKANRREVLLRLSFKRFTNAKPISTHPYVLREKTLFIKQVKNLTQELFLLNTPIRKYTLSEKTSLKNSCTLR